MADDTGRPDDPAGEEVEAEADDQYVSDITGLRLDYGPFNRRKGSKTGHSRVRQGRPADDVEDAEQ